MSDVCRQAEPHDISGYEYHYMSAQLQCTLIDLHMYGRAQAHERAYTPLAEDQHQMQAHAHFSSLACGPEISP